MVNDHLSDMITRIRNGYAAGLTIVELPAYKAVVAVARVLQESGYLESVEIEGKTAKATLKYKGKVPAVTGIKRISKPGVRVYGKIGKLPRAGGGLGMNILSTPKGIISEKKARQLRAGGEILAQVW